MLGYLVYANIFGVVFVLLHRAFIQKTSSLDFSRGYLLVACILTLLLPLISIDLSLFQNQNLAAATSAYPLPEIIIQTNTKLQTTDWQPNWLIIAYASIVLILLARLGIQYFSVWNFISKSEKQKLQGYKLILNTEKGPGSFFATILLPNSEIDETTIRHELAHIRLKHSYDKLFVQILICFFPIVFPLIWFKKELERVHEYQADAVACSDIQIYAKLLLNQHFNTKQFSPMLSFLQNPLKNRIMMLRNKKKMNLVKGLSLGILVTACSVAVLTAQNTKATGSETPNQNAQEKAMAAIALPQSSNQTNRDTPTYTKKIVDENGVATYYGFSANVMHGSLSADTVTEDNSDVVKEMSEFPGGRAALIDYLGKNIIYPKDDSASGKVVIEFVISKAGTIEDAKILRGVSPKINEAAMSVVKNMPRWAPAKDENGNAVSSYFTLPIDFQRP